MDFDDDERYQRLMKIILEVTCFDERKHTIDSGIASDMGCEGSDAEELLERIAEEFKVDFSGFDFYDYFVDESVCSWMLISMIDRWSLNFRDKKEITIRHLYEAIVRGRWQTSD